MLLASTNWRDMPSFGEMKLHFASRRAQMRQANQGKYAHDDHDDDDHHHEGRKFVLLNQRAREREKKQN